MKETTLRKLHRSAGAIFFVFIVLQVISGLFFSIGEIAGTRLNGFLYFLHLQQFPWGGWYRVILAAGLLFIGITGMLIAIRIFNRSRHKQTGRSVSR